MAIEFAAFPDLNAQDFTNLAGWIFQLRCPRGGGSITKLLEELGIVTLTGPGDEDVKDPFIVEMRRYTSPRTGWKSLTFRANAAAIAKLHGATLESEFEEVRTNVRQIVAACHTRKGQVRTGKVVLNFEPAWACAHIKPHKAIAQ